MATRTRSSRPATKKNRYEEEIDDVEDDLDDLEDELEEDDDEDELPPKKTKAKAKPAPKKSRKVVEEDDDDDEDEDVEEDDDDDEDEEEPSKKSRRKPATKKSAARKSTNKKSYSAKVLNQDENKILTPKGRVMFPNLFSKYVSEGDEEEDGKYMVTLMFDENTDLSVLEEAVEEALDGMFKKRPKGWKNPIRDAENEEEEEKVAKYPCFEGMRFISASTMFKPGVIDLQKNELFDEDDVYQGCYGRMSVVPYAWSFKGKSGVSFGLRNFQKLDDGEVIRTGGNASDDFDD